MHVMEDYVQWKPNRWPRYQNLRIMKLTLFLLVIVVGTQANGISQTVTMSGNNIPLKKVFATIKQQTDYVVFYGDKHILKQSTPVSIIAKGMELTEFLDEVLKDQPLRYEIVDKTISILPAKPNKNTDPTERSTVIINGRVVNENGEPVVAASVQIKGTEKGTVTNEEGVFTFSDLQGDETLVISGVGIETFEIKIAGRTQLVLQAKLKATTVGEVIVTGYGSYNRKDYTGAANVVKTSNLKDVPTVSIADRLVGTTPGMQITLGSGQPGAAESIRIRGLGSINAGNEPLIVIDGIPVINGNVSKVGGTAAGTSLLASINPSDIESLTVIKDAAAASLYGSRAANGVIVITTKTGKQGKTAINVKTDIGFSNMAVDYRPLLNGNDKAKLLQLGIENYAIDNGFALDNPAIQRLNVYTTEPWSGWTDWRKELTRTGKRQNYEFSISGGNEQTKIYTSLAYTNQEGVSRGAAFKRIAGRINAAHQVGRLQLFANTLLTSINQDIDFEGGTTSPFAASSFYVSPADYPYNQDGSFNTTAGFTGVYGSINNPKLLANYNYNKNNTLRTLNNVGATINIISGLRIKQQLSYDYVGAAGQSWLDPRTGPGISTNGKFTRVNDSYAKLVWQTQLYYEKAIFDKHFIDAFAGYEGENYKTTNATSVGEDYPNAQLPEIANAARSTSTSVIAASGLISYLSRLNYNYDKRYYVSASYRRDGSSRLSPESRWGNFWSVSGAWRLADEAFWKNSNAGKIFTDAKLKASYGVNGTQPTDWFGFDGLYRLGNNYDGLPGSAESSIPNPSLTWEKNLSFNVGAELTILDRVNLSIEYYNRNTKDLLVLQPISQVTGFVNYWRNIGSMNNRGIEISADTRLINRRDFTWTVSANASFNKNKLTQLAAGQNEIISYPFIRQVGLAYNTYHAFERAGIDPETGKQLYYKNTPVKDNDGNITGYDRTTVNTHTLAQKVALGQMEPKWFGGFSSSIQWKGLHVNILFSYTLGGHIYDHYGVYQADGADYAYTGGLASFYDINKVWKQPGDKAELPRFTYSRIYPASDRWLLSTDHLRLKSLSVAHDIPESWRNALKLSNARLFASASNLFTIKRSSLYVDPESVANGGLLTGETPPLKTIVIGLEINF